MINIIFYILNLRKYSALEWYLKSKEVALNMEVLRNKYISVVNMDILNIPNNFIKVTDYVLLYHFRIKFNNLIKSIMNKIINKIIFTEIWRQIH